MISPLSNSSIRVITARQLVRFLSDLRPTKLAKQCWSTESQVRVPIKPKRANRPPFDPLSCG